LIEMRTGRDHGSILLGDYPSMNDCLIRQTLSG